MQMLCAPLLSAAAESPVYPRPQRMEISATYTTVTEVSVRKRGKKSRGGMWEHLPKVKEVYAISTQSVFSDEWTHSQMILVRGQHLKVERCGISEAIDERAKHIMKRCLADWKQQSKKIRK